jgi:hypothetical protein
MKGQTRPQLNLLIISNMRKLAKAATFLPICVSVTASRHGHLRQLAVRHDTSVSAIVNAALDDLLAVQNKASVRKRLSDAPLRCQRRA